MAPPAPMSLAPAAYGEKPCAAAASTGPPPPPLAASAPPCIARPAHGAGRGITGGGPGAPPPSCQPNPRASECSCCCSTWYGSCGLHTTGLDNGATPVSWSACPLTEAARGAHPSMTAPPPTPPAKTPPPLPPPPAAAPNEETFVPRERCSRACTFAFTRFGVRAASRRHAGPTPHARTRKVTHIHIYTDTATHTHRSKQKHAPSTRHHYIRAAHRHRAREKSPPTAQESPRAAAARGPPPRGSTHLQRTTGAIRVMSHSNPTPTPQAARAATHPRTVQAEGTRSTARSTAREAMMHEAITYIVRATTHLLRCSTRHELCNDRPARRVTLLASHLRRVNKETQKQHACDTQKQKNNTRWQQGDPPLRSPGPEHRPPLDSTPPVVRAARACSTHNVTRVRAQNTRAMLCHAHHTHLLQARVQHLAPPLLGLQQGTRARAIFAAAAPRPRPRTHLNPIHTAHFPRDVRPYQSAPRALNDLAQARVLCQCESLTRGLTPPELNTTRAKTSKTTRYAAPARSAEQRALCAHTHHKSTRQTAHAQQHLPRPASSSDKTRGSALGERRRASLHRCRGTRDLCVSTHALAARGRNSDTHSSPLASPSSPLASTSSMPSPSSLSPSPALDTTKSDSSSPAARQQASGRCCNSRAPPHTEGVYRRLMIRRRAYTAVAGRALRLPRNCHAGPSTSARARTPATRARFAGGRSAASRLAPRAAASAVS